MDSATKLTRGEALGKLRELAGTAEGDPESAHLNADLVLLDFIADPEIRAAWEAIEKWFA